MSWAQTRPRVARPHILSRVPVEDGGLALSSAMTLVDAKRHLNVYHDDDNAYIETLVDVARAHMEGDDGTGGIVGSAITRHMLEMTLDAFPDDGVIVLPQPPLVSVGWVRYRDESGDLLTLSDTLYRVVPHPLRPRVERVHGTTWPTTATRSDAVVVRYTCGPASVPTTLLHALRLHVGHLYVNREIVSERGMATVPMAYDALVMARRQHGWI